MEIEKRKVETDQIDLLNTYSLYGITLWIHRLNGVYRIERKHNGMNKMTFWGPKKY